jgi:hypothetical protein
MEHIMYHAMRKGAEIVGGSQLITGINNNVTKNIRPKPFAQMPTMAVARLKVLLFSIVSEVINPANKTNNRLI